MIYGRHLEKSGVVTYPERQVWQANYEFVIFDDKYYVQLTIIGRHCRLSVVRFVDVLQELHCKNGDKILETKYERQLLIIGKHCRLSVVRLKPFAHVTQV